MKKRILVVDDSKDIRDSVDALLRFEGYDVVQADCGEASLKELRNGNIDLVLLDLKMPGMTTEELFAEFVKTGMTRPIIVYSGTYEQDYVDQLQKASGIRIAKFIRKPFDNKYLLESIRLVLLKNKRLAA